MAPTLLPDDWCLVVRPRGLRRGDVVVVEHPDRDGYEMVKRVMGIPGDHIDGQVLGTEEFWVVGDQPEASTDSRGFGPVSIDRLKARVLLVYGPRHRRRIIPRSL